MLTSQGQHCTLFLFVSFLALLLLVVFFSFFSPRVPFAQPPVGKLRLRDPLPKKGLICGNDSNNDGLTVMVYIS